MYNKNDVAKEGDQEQNRKLHKRTGRLSLMKNPQSGACLSAESKYLSKNQ